MRRWTPRRVAKGTAVVKEPTTQSFADEIFGYVADTYSDYEEPMMLLELTISDCNNEDEDTRQRRALCLLDAIAMWW